jgi:hypothetical protein
MRHPRRAERASLQARASIENIDYLPPDSVVFRRWAGSQVVGRVWDRWAMFLAIGVAVGLAGFCVHLLIDIMAFVKAREGTAALRARGAAPASLCAFVL